jgi:hypothetical protein
MFCVKCGQVLEEGKSFCNNCGVAAPAGQVTAGADTAGGATLSLDATAVRTVVDGGTPPPAAYGAGGGWQPPQGQSLGTPYGAPQGPPPGGNRTGIIVGSIAAAIIVLAGAGVGLWLGLRDDGGNTDSTKVVSSTTTKVTTGGETTSSSGGAATTQTIPGLNTTTSGPGPTGSTGTTADLLTEWYIAHENLVMEMDYDNGRIPELADAINANAPDVPDWVYGELEDMADILQVANQTMAATPVPSGFDDAHHWILQAATHMANRIQATMNGISAMWDTGSINSATAFFDTGRAERDAYVAALEEHYTYMPAD